MFKKTKLLFALVVIVASFAFVSQGGWVQVKSHGFAVEFPKKPEVDSQAVPSAIGDLMLNTFMYEPSQAGDDNLVYGIMLTKYPDSLIKSNDTVFTKTVFRNVIDGAAVKAGGKLLSEKEIALDGYPGREVRIDYQNGVAVIKMRMYMAKSTMYLIQTIAEPKKENNKSEVRFLNSFKLVK